VAERGNDRRWWQRPAAVRAARGGGRDAATSPVSGLMGGGARLGLSGWGNTNEVRGCQRAAA
jgi:hypothetical protein